MEYLTAAILSGLIYDGVKAGATLSFEMLKSKLQGWLIDDDQLNLLVQRLRDAGINDDLAEHAIERKINEHEDLLILLEKVRPSGDITIPTQKSHIGHNIYSSGNGNVSVGSIINKDSE